MLSTRAAALRPGATPPGGCGPRPGSGGLPGLAGAPAAMAAARWPRKGSP